MWMSIRCGNCAREESVCMKETLMIQRGQSDQVGAWLAVEGRCNWTKARVSRTSRGLRRTFVLGADAFGELVQGWS